MKFKYKTKISINQIIINSLVLTSFFYLIFNADRFASYTEPTIVKAYTENLSVLKEEISDGSTINVNNIYIDNNLDGVITYIVVPGDNLGKIAENFGVTVSHIKQVNHLKSDKIKPGQVLKITEENGFLYNSKGETANQLAKKFNIKVEDLLSANGLNDNNYKFDKGDEVFIPMSEGQYKKYLASLKKAKKPVPHRTYIQRPTRKPSSTTSSRYTYRGKNVVAKYRYRPNITNGFYRGHCTRYVAIKKFPYISKNKQKKLWNGNAKYWYKNAARAGYKVGHSPRVGSIVVIRVGGRHYYYAGHVAIVKQIDWTHRRLLIEEMNAFGKYVVSRRWIPMNSKIIGYIYL